MSGGSSGRSSRSLIMNSAPGYHLYVLNRVKPALALAAALS